ncbi:hypothetical protein [Mycobacterium sp. GA-2829]|uniref:hypothetical protein n=1 Tax=Mycobacterium sp. GA-2829 TaxID=1772283 RepID=UPI000AC001D6|nr:hypothetical protein [Mycobacterium sp. GA-2829]
MTTTSSVRSARFARLVAAGVTAAALLALAPVPSAHARPPLGDTVCTGPRADAAALQQEIAAHNAKPHVFELPREQAGFDAYNAEADALDARAAAIDARLTSCLTAAYKLSGPSTGPGIPAAMPATLPSLVKRAHTGAPSRQEEIEELISVFDDAAQEYDDAWTDQVLQNKEQPEVGDSDPAFEDREIGADDSGEPQVTPDYVIPLSDVLEMPKFLQLSPESMWMVTMSPINRQWISDQAVLAKNSPSVAAFTGVDDDWLQAQAKLADAVRQQLQDAIDILAESDQDQQQ